MAGQRLRGDDTFISILSAGELEDRIDSIESSDFTHEMDLQEDDFLGESTSRFDSLFKGTKFTITGQLANRAFLDFVQKVTDKAQRRAGSAARFDITTTFIFLNGETYTIAYEDCSFGSIPVQTGSRGDYVKWTVDGACSQGREVT